SQFLYRRGRYRLRIRPNLSLRLDRRHQSKKPRKWRRKHSIPQARIPRRYQELCQQASGVPARIDLEQWFGESQFESYRSLGFTRHRTPAGDLEAILDALIKRAKTVPEEKEEAEGRA